MGLFDNLFGDKAADRRNLTEAEAFAGILMAAAACDGHAGRQEVAELRTHLGRMKLFADLTDGRWRQMADILFRMVKRDGVIGMADRCAAVLPPELRDCAFANACDLILADGVVEDAERAFLEHLQRALDLDSDTALSIVEVMITKNKG
ncbi:MAG TPA: tellurite resistance TerB family protein [Gemmataceae bacterium]|jgi:tellurite resistance protein|nr:tellurite resistance TerB family protein [Gemmataceae bacterium]